MFAFWIFSLLSSSQSSSARFGCSSKPMHTDRPTWECEGGPKKCWSSSQTPSTSQACRLSTFFCYCFFMLASCNCELNSRFLHSTTIPLSSEIKKKHCKIATQCTHTLCSNVGLKCILGAGVPRPYATHAWKLSAALSVYAKKRANTKPAQRMERLHKLKTDERVEEQANIIKKRVAHDYIERDFYAVNKVWIWEEEKKVPVHRD